MSTTSTKQHPLMQTILQIYIAVNKINPFFIELHERVCAIN